MTKERAGEVTGARVTDVYGIATGYVGRRDVLCLWSNAGRRELGLEGFDEPWSPDYRLAFVRAADSGRR